MQSTDTSMRDKVCLITGATSGIGLVTARELARQGARVVLVGRNADKCAAVVKEIQDLTGNREVTALLADLSSQRQIHELAQQFRERYSRLDVLVNNAGGMWLKRQVTVDGLEMTFAVNHMAYFLLTHLLLDMLQASAPARIINVSSGAHRKASMDFDDLVVQAARLHNAGEPPALRTRSYGGWRAYCRSKIANLLFTYELARRLEGTGVTANALHPGWVYTGFGGSNGWKGNLLQLAARFFAISPEEGAQTIIYLATSSEVAKTTGGYFVRKEAVLSSTESRDDAAAKRLWDISLELAKVPGERVAAHLI